MGSRSRKKAKTSNKPSEKNVSLKHLVGMPLDIIFEIFGHLDPLDILQLARTTQALRVILMSRSSLSLWKRVRHAYHRMPDGPEGMSEPQYISLAFEEICFGCGVSSARTWVHIYWHARLRSCQKCDAVLLCNQSRMKSLPYKELPPSLMDLVTNYDYRYSFNQVQSWLQQYMSLTGSSSSAKLEWENEILKQNELLKKHIASFRSWVSTRKEEEAAEHQRLMDDMKELLLTKLKELGWGEELDRMGTYDRYQLECQLATKNPKTFPQAWSLNGRSIVKSLKAVQAVRLEKEWKMLLSTRYKVLQSIYREYILGLPADMLIIPNIADVGLSPAVYAILTDKQANFNVTRETFENINLVQTLPSIVSDWKDRLDERLIQMVRVTLSEPFTKDHLPLATTVFYCNACHINLFYPHVLVHRCATPFEGDRIEMDPVQCPAWNSSGSIKFRRDTYQAAIDIIDLLGLDPKVVTTEEMIARNSVLQCLDCRKTRQGRMTMIWSRAIDHSRIEHQCRPAMVSWKVPGHEGQLRLQASLAQELAASDRPRYMCGRCRRRGTIGEVKCHLLEMHNIYMPGDNDILLHPDGIHVPTPSVLPESD